MDKKLNIKKIIDEIDRLFDSEFKNITNITAFKNTTHEKKSTSINIHYYYPIVFYDFYKSIDIKYFKILSVCSRLFLYHCLLNDRIIDNRERTIEPREVFAKSLLQEKVLSMLYSIYGIDSDFWKYFNKYYSEYIRAVIKEQNEHFNKISKYSFDDLKIIAKGKSALAKIATAGLSILKGSTEEIEILDKSQDYFYIAFQLYDDLIDWKEDLKNRQFSFILTNLIIENAIDKVAFQSEKINYDLIGRYLYYSKAAENALGKAEQYYKKALNILGNYKFLSWRKIVSDYLITSNKLRVDIIKIRMNNLNKVNKKDDLKGEKSTKRLYFRFNQPTYKIVKESIDKSIDFILASQKDSGFWKDFQLDVGPATEWVTGYICNALVSVADFTKFAKEKLRKSSIALINAKHPNGGWGFNRESGADADSTSNVLIFLNRIKSIIKKDIDKAIKILKENQNNDGGIGTYSTKEILREQEKFNVNFSAPVEIYSGWISSDTQITAISVLAMLNLGIRKDSSIIKNAISFIINKQQNKGYWNAYWSNGKTLGTSQCIHTLNRFENHNEYVDKALIWFIDTQSIDGGWSDQSSQVLTPYDTALALGSIMVKENIKNLNPIKKGIKWLLSNQLKDGSWESFPIMTIPKPWEENQLDNPIKRSATKDTNRIFTTATVLKSLSRYYELINKL